MVPVQIWHNEEQIEFVHLKLTIISKLKIINLFYTHTHTNKKPFYVIVKTGLLG